MDPYKCIILDYVLQHGSEMRLLVPMEAENFVELLNKGSLQQETLRRIAQAYVERENAVDKSQFRHRVARDYVLAVSEEIAEAGLPRKISREDWDDGQSCGMPLCSCNKRRRFSE